MTKKRFLLNSFGILLWIILLVAPGQVVRAQVPDCLWQLTSETSKEFTASSAPEASASNSGTSVVVNWKGLTTTHSWTYPGTSLKPGDSLEINVSASWTISSGDAMNSTGGLKTSFYFGSENVSAGQKTIHFNAEKNGSVSNSGSFIVPKGSGDGATLSMYGHADAAVGGGRTDYLFTYVCATPTPSQTATITKTPTKTATKCSALTEEQKLSKILAIYNKKIPNGITSSGEKNNIYDLFGYPGYSEFVCGGYQSKVLNLLNSIKFSKDPCEQELLSGWEYGPIQAWWGGHQAVVIYPWATNWMETGLVLDPWPLQTPMAYAMAEWAVMFSASGVVPVIGNIPENITGGSYIGIGESDVYRSDGAYPMFGGVYQEAGNKKFTAEEKSIIESLSPEKKITFWNLPKPDQKAYLQRRLANQSATQKTIAHCPLNLYVMDANGKRSGISGDKILSELPNVSFLALKLTDGTNYTEITYPENVGYSLVLESTGQGQATALTSHTLLLGDQAPALQQYSFPVEANSTYQIPTDKLGAAMVWDGGTLQPQTLAGITEEWLNSLPGLVAIKGAQIEPGEEIQSNPTQPPNQNKPPLIQDFVLPTWAAVLILLFGLVLFGVLMIVIIARLVKNRNGQSQLAGRGQGSSGGAIIWLVLVILVTSACLTTLCGGIGLYRSLKSSPIDVAEHALNPTLTAIVATEVSLAQQVTSANQGIQMTATLPIPMDTPLPSLPNTPVPAALPSVTPEPSEEIIDLTGDQYLDDHSIKDDFSSRALGWLEMDDGRKILKYEEGGYSFQLKAKDDFDVVYLPVPFNPSEIIFDVRGLEGDQDGTFGIFCHLQDVNNYYYVEFDLQTSSYVIAQSRDGEYIPLTAETDAGQFWHTADAMKGASSTNHINIGCYLGTIFIMINDEIVDEVSIGEPFTQKGKTALFVFTYPFADDDGYKVIFDNLEAFEPMQ